jgi:hypothetical protein
MVEIPAMALRMLADLRPLFARLAINLDTEAGGLREMILTRNLRKRE